MNMNNIFSGKRFIYLINRDLTGSLVKILIVSGAVAGVLLPISAYMAYTGNAPGRMYYSFFKNILFIAGLIITSSSFWEMHRKTSVQSYLLLPASNFEKFSSRLFLTSIGFSILVVIGLFLFSCFSEGLNTLLFKRHNILFNPFSTYIWITIARYIVIQSIFLLGAVYFKKHNFLKTVNTILITIFILTVLGLILIKIEYADFFHNFYTIEESQIRLFTSYGSPLQKVLQIIFWVLPAPLFWTIAYFRLKEAEVKNAI